MLIVCLHKLRLLFFVSFDRSIYDNAVAALQPVAVAAAVDCCFADAVANAVIDVRSLKAEQAEIAPVSLFCVVGYSLAWSALLLSLLLLVNMPFS